MPKIRAIVVDDEVPARNELKYILQNNPSVETIGTFANGKAVLEYLKEFPEAADIVFLDIEMPVMDGIETAIEIEKITDYPKLVFSTGFPQFAIKAFDMAIFDYILKPYSDVRINKTINRLKSIQCQNNKLKVNGEIVVENGLFSISIAGADEKIIVLNSVEEIIFVRSIKKGNTLFYTTRGILESKIILRDIEERLRPYSFFRTHKSYIVNLKMIREIEPWFNDTYVLVMSKYKDEEVPVSRHYLKDFKMVMNIF